VCGPTPAGAIRFRRRLFIVQGKTEVNRFAGQEGRQGPYRLAVSDGTQDFAVLANSQKVWLDGDPW